MNLLSFLSYYSSNYEENKLFLSIATLVSISSPIFVISCKNESVNTPKSNAISTEHNKKMRLNSEINPNNEIEKLKSTKNNSNQSILNSEDKDSMNIKTPSTPNSIENPDAPIENEINNQEYIKKLLFEIGEDEELKSENITLEKYLEKVDKYGSIIDKFYSNLLPKYENVVNPILSDYYLVVKSILNDPQRERERIKKRLEDDKHKAYYVKTLKDFKEIYPEVLTLTKK
ncbi:hypothetical protein [Metamycoplasma auris]|uniref:Uncharacterized protein n=1 Tax=Metamycoplasma auris TaxID=51363 RepID=A0A2W7GCS7_9BACT|nr:hypothetical protein [Metamycoplasma auris]PZW01498.1 hypothetical protein BCF89_10113 [Metamycoplasma auris]